MVSFPVFNKNYETGRGENKKKKIKDIFSVKQEHKSIELKHIFLNNKLYTVFSFDK